MLEGGNVVNMKLIIARTCMGNLTPLPAPCSPPQKPESKMNKQVEKHWTTINTHNTCHCQMRQTGFVLFIIIIIIRFFRWLLPKPLSLHDKAML